jgi:hypothetical protein
MGDRIAGGLAVQVAAGLLFLALLWMLLRFALGLRYSKVLREEARDAQGGRVVVEIPSAQGEVGFFVEEPEAFAWPNGRAPKAEIVGTRLLLRGGVIGEAARAGAGLPPAGPADELEGRERWDVVLYLRDGATATVACGTLREGVSREVAARVFESVRASLVASPPLG